MEDTTDSTRFWRTSCKRSGHGNRCRRNADQQISYLGISGASNQNCSSLIRTTVSSMQCESLFRPRWLYIGIPCSIRGLLCEIAGYATLRGSRRYSTVSLAAVEYRLHRTLGCRLCSTNANFGKSLRPVRRSTSY